MIVVQAIVSAILTSVGSGLIKYGLNRLEMPAGASGFLSVPVLLVAARSPFVVCGLLMGFSGTLNYVCMLGRSDLNIVVPLISACSWVILIAFSASILKEPFTLMRVVGLALTIAGTVVLALAARSH